MPCFESPRTDLPNNRALVELLVGISILYFAAKGSFNTIQINEMANSGQIRHLLEKVAVQRSASVRMADLQERLQAEAPDTDFDSAAPVMRSVLEVVSRAAQSDVSVLFRGESGQRFGQRR